MTAIWNVLRVYATVFLVGGAAFGLVVAGMYLFGGT